MLISQLWDFLLYSFVSRNRFTSNCSARIIKYTKTPLSRPRPAVALCVAHNRNAIIEARNLADINEQSELGTITWYSLQGSMLGPCYGSYFRQGKYQGVNIRNMVIPGSFTHRPMDLMHWCHHAAMYPLGRIHEPMSYLILLLNEGPFSLWHHNA